MSPFGINLRRTHTTECAPSEVPGASVASEAEVPFDSQDLGRLASRVLEVDPDARLCVGVLMMDVDAQRMSLDAARQHLQGHLDQ